MNKRLPQSEPERSARRQETAPSPERLRQARAEWQAAPAMNDRTLRQWWDNVRLRWDCHSTAIEGSSLTYQDTLTVLVDRQVPPGQPALWEIEQIQGHNDAAYQLARWHNLGHVPDLEDLHAIHRMMLVRPYAAQAVGGGRVGRYVTLGRYKTVANAVYSPEGLVEFAPPQAVPVRMRAWWERSTQRNAILAHDPQALDPAWALASSHWDFVAIHPYDDGNGRLARWITNWMSMAMGYPPIVITLEQRECYFACFQGMDANVEAVSPAQEQRLRDFLAARLLEAVRFGVAVAEGRTDPSYRNEQAALDRPVPASAAYTLETTVPRIRPQDRRDAADGTAAGDSRWRD